MKKKFLKSIIALFLGLTVLISCDSYLDINTDPTLLKDVKIPQSLPAAQANLAFNMGLDLFFYSSIFVQQGAGQGIAGTQTRTYDQYVVTNTDVNNTFNIFYAGVLADLRYLQGISAAENPHHLGVAKLLEAFTFGIMVDAWGDLPYREALKGVDNVQPAYNGSREIYDSLFIKIDGAIVNLQQENFLPMGEEDLIYGGDIDQWMKFAYTLKLRLALHYAKVDAGVKLRAVIDEVENSTDRFFMESNADNFQMTFVDDANRQNPYYQFEIQRNDYYAPGAFLINLMNSKSDPRRATYFTPFPAPKPLVVTPASTYAGTVSGDATVAPYSRLHTFFKGAVKSDNQARTPAGGVTSTALVYAGDAPVRMLTFAEYNFIRAEAALVYGGAGDANAFFAAGVTASMQEAGVAPADIAAYLAAQTPVTLTLEDIINEKYVATLGVAVEPWTDWRRTGFPNIAPSPAAVAQGNTVIPRILVYPLGEQQANLANLPPRTSMTAKSVFWDN